MHGIRSPGDVHIYDRPKRAGKRCKHEIAVGELVISSGDTAKMLDAIEEALDQVARTVQPTVVALCLAIRTRRGDNLRAGRPNLLHEGVGVVALVSDNRSCASSPARIGSFPKLTYRDRYGPLGVVHKNICWGSAVE